MSYSVEQIAHVFGMKVEEVVKKFKPHFEPDEFPKMLVDEMGKPVLRDTGAHVIFNSPDEEKAYWDKQMPAKTEAPDEPEDELPSPPPPAKKPKESVRG